MNTLLNIYFKLPHDKTLGIVTKVFNRLVAKILKRILDNTVPKFFLKTQLQYPDGLNTEKRDNEVIVSFTSFPGRIGDLWIVVECLFRQSYKADRIILWLSKSQFEGIELPKLLLAQEERGLEIRFVEDDLRSHKKYYYALKSFDSSIIITVDDDVFYHQDMLRTLIEANANHPNEVVANRAHRIKFDENHQILPYRQWEINYKSQFSSFLYVPTGVGGVLYPPGSLSTEILDVNAIKSLCYHADDLWLKAGSLLTNSKVFITHRFRQEFITIGGSQASKLVAFNSLKGENDNQFSETRRFFKLGDLEHFR